MAFAAARMIKEKAKRPSMDLALYPVSTTYSWYSLASNECAHFSSKVVVSQVVEAIISQRRSETGKWIHFHCFPTNRVTPTIWYYHNTLGLPAKRDDRAHFLAICIRYRWPLHLILPSSQNLGYLEQFETFFGTKIQSVCNIYDRKVLQMRARALEIWKADKRAWLVFFC